MEYLLAVKKNILLIHAVIWRNLKTFEAKKPGILYGSISTGNRKEKSNL